MNSQPTNPTIDEELRNGIKSLLIASGTKHPPEGLLDLFCGLVYEHDKALIGRVERAKAIEVANWAVHFTDKIELRNPAPDDMWRTFKFIRNGLRDEFKAAYGVDPSPTHDPASAQLISPNVKEEEE